VARAHAGPEKFGLAKMLEEIKRDERAGKAREKKVLSQDEIRAMARRRRNPEAKNPPAK
jgi:hypothetical protein